MTLRWSVAEATSVAIVGIGFFEATGSVTVYPSTSMGYTLVATGTAATKEATASVQAAGTNGPLISSFSAAPATVTPGASDDAVLDGERGDLALHLRRGAVSGTSVSVSPSAPTTCSGRRPRV